MESDYRRLSTWSRKKNRERCTFRHSSLCPRLPAVLYTLLSFVSNSNTVDMAVETLCATLCDTGESESDLERLLDDLRRTMGSEKLQDACPDRTSQLLNCIMNLRNAAKCDKIIEGTSIAQTTEWKREFSRYCKFKL